MRKLHDQEVCTIPIVRVRLYVRPLAVSENVHMVYFDQNLHMYACQHSSTDGM